MIAGPFKELVKVSGKHCEITVYQKSKSVWEAVGEHHGKTFRTTDRSRKSAATAWVRKVEYDYHQN
jgi:hypothetical protein